MPVTIKDVAKKANVSSATVSLVVNKNKRISEETRARVLKAIKDLHYYPSRSAIGLVSKHTGNIGFILTDDHFSRSEPFYTKIFIGTEFQARDDHYYVLLTTIPNTFNKCDPLPRFILERNVDGVILAGRVPKKLIECIGEYKLPIVFVDYYPVNSNYSVVMCDNISGGLQATQHLIECGHRSIAFIYSDMQHPSISERFQGYRMALEKFGLNPFSVTDGQSTDRISGYKAAKKLLNQNNNVTAIFACNDAMAIGVLQYLREKHIQVPKEISIVGFDDVEADLSIDPSLTTMRVNKEEMGIQTLRLMVEMLQNETTKPRKVLVPVELIVRGSTCRIK
jgi:LacI family transcriptional regulator